MSGPGMVMRYTVDMEGKILDKDDPERKSNFPKTIIDRKGKQVGPTGLPKIIL